MVLKLLKDLRVDIVNNHAINYLKIIKCITKSVSSALDTDPNLKTTSNMISLGTHFMTLTFANTGYLINENNTFVILRKS